MAGGRPTTYTPEVVEEAWAYTRGEWESVHEHAVPSVVGLCSAIKRSKTCIYDWAKVEGNEFSDILKEIHENQELVVFGRSLTGDYNSTMAKLMLTKHGYSDKQDNTHTGANGGPISLSDMTEEQLDKKLSELVQATNGAE